MIVQVLPHSLQSHKRQLASLDSDLHLFRAGQLSTAPTDATSRKKSAEEAPIDWHRSGSVLTRLPGRVSKKKSATIRLSRLVNPLESVEEDSVSRTKSQEEASWFNCLENGVIPATLSEYVQKFKAAAVVLKGEGSPDEVGWSSTDTVSGIAEGIVALITMLDVSQPSTLSLFIALACTFIFVQQNLECRSDMRSHSLNFLRRCMAPTVTT